MPPVKGDTKKDVDPDTWVISPSQLNTFNNCEYLWFLEKCMGIRQPPNAAMTRGTAYHEAVEKLWEYNVNTTLKGGEERSPDGTMVEPHAVPFNLGDQDEKVRRAVVTPFGSSFKRHGIKCFEEAWAKNRAKVSQDLEKYDSLHDSSLRAFLQYVDKSILAIESLVEEREHTYPSAYQKVRPWMRERKVYSKAKTEVGVLDYAYNTADGRLIGDWKTGHPFGVGHNPEYANQLMFYCYLDQDQNDMVPSFAEINYVLHGLQVRYAITSADIDSIRYQILRMRERIREVQKGGSSYVKNTSYKFCKQKSDGTGGCWYGNSGFCDRMA